MAFSRRTFIKTGIAGGSLLLLSGWATKGVFWGARSRRAVVAGKKLAFLTDADAKALRAMAPSLIAGPFTEAGPEREEILNELVVGFDTAAAGMLPSVQAEIRQLMALLTLPPARVALGHRFSNWDNADPGEVDDFLNRVRNSGMGLLRSAYDALFQLSVAAWYGNPRSWKSIGYAGPPRLV